MFYTTPSPDFYSLLQVPRDALPNDIKTAYHRTLLRLHPDKQSRLRHHRHGLAVSGGSLTDTPADHPRPSLPPSPLPDKEKEKASVDIALLKEAYKTLSDVHLRAVYDGSLRREAEDARAQSCGPRPAQVVSFEEFVAAEAEMTDSAQEWRYRCRCGGTYGITQDDLENGTHLVGCEGCSEAIWVGYEEVVMSE